MMTLFFCTAVSPDGAIYVSLVLNVDILKMLNDVYFMFMFDGHYQRSSLEMRKSKDAV